MVTKKRFSEDGETPPEKRRMILADSKAALDAFNPSDNSKNGVITPILDSEEWAPPSEVARTNSAKSVGSRPTKEFLFSRMEKIRFERRKLPIYQESRRPTLKWDLRYHTNIIILVGETGSGKSTQVPQFLEYEPYNKRQRVKITTKDGKEKMISVGGTVAITEPRRVAVTNLANRVAAETGSHLQPGKNNGMTTRDRVSYSIRFEHVNAPGEQIKFLTEGMLLQEMRDDPWLTKYGAVIVDEIHERSVDVDLLAGLLKKILWSNFEGRGGVPLKVVVMSATADVNKLKEFFERPLGIKAESNSPEVTQASSLESVTKTKVNSLKDKDSLNKQSVASLPHDSRRSSDTSAASDFHGFSEDEPAEDKSVEASGEESNVAKPLAVSEGESTKVEQSETSIEVTPKTINAIVHHVEGRQHNVEVFYFRNPSHDGYMSEMKDMIMKINMTEPTGDILCFVPGRDDIDRLTEDLRPEIKKHCDDAKSKKLGIPILKVHALYGQQTMEEQRATLRAAKEGHRKVIISTNVAETSVTVPGVKYVIDSGMAKIKEFHPELNLESLLRKDISKSSADQRKGRAGRQSEGKCYRLYSLAEYESRPPNDVPEIKRSNITSAVLRMKVFGIEKPLDFEWLDRPEPAAITNALSCLITLGALDKEGNLTPLGKQLERFPISPEYARVLVAASQGRDGVICILEAIDIIAVLTCGEDVFLHSKDYEEESKFSSAQKSFQSRAGDMITMLNVIRQYLAIDASKKKHFEWCKDNYINASNMKTAMSIRSDLIRLCRQEGLLKDIEIPHLPHTFLAPSENLRDAILYVFNLPWEPFENKELRAKLERIVKPVWYGSPADVYEKIPEAFVVCVES